MARAKNNHAVCFSRRQHSGYGIIFRYRLVKKIAIFAIYKVAQPESGLH